MRVDQQDKKKERSESERTSGSAERKTKRRKKKKKKEKKALEQVSGQNSSNLGGPQGPLRLWHAAKYFQTKLLQIKTRFLVIFPQKSVFFLPQKANQSSSLSLSFYNLNITGDYRHLSFPFYSKASLPRLIQVILFYSSIPHPGPSFPNPPELPNLIHFSQNRSCRTSSNESGQACFFYRLTSGTGPAKLNLLPFVKV